MTEEVSVAESGDDGMEENGVFNSTAPVLVHTFPGIAAFRLLNVPIPQGANIPSAVITLVADMAGFIIVSGGGFMSIQAEAVGNAAVLANGLGSWT